MDVVIDIEGDAAPSPFVPENIDQDDKTQRKYFALRRRCEQIQQSNEKLVNRLQHVKRLTKRYKRERRFLMARLDKHGDVYREQLVPALWEECVPSSLPLSSPAGVSTSQHNVSLSRVNIISSIGNDGASDNDISNEAFINFCREQKQNPTELTQENGDNLTSQELQAQLLKKWLTLSHQQKQLYGELTSEESLPVDVKVQLRDQHIRQVSTGQPFTLSHSTHSVKQETT